MHLIVFAVAGLEATQVLCYLLGLSVSFLFSAVCLLFLCVCASLVRFFCEQIPFGGGSGYRPHRGSTATTRGTSGPVCVYYNRAPADQASAGPWAGAPGSSNRREEII